MTLYQINKIWNLSRKYGLTPTCLDPSAVFVKSSSMAFAHHVTKWQELKILINTHIEKHGNLA